MTSLPSEVLEMIALNLYGNDKVRPMPVPSQREGTITSGYERCSCMQVNMALYCKTLLPVLYKAL